MFPACRWRTTNCCTPTFASCGQGEEQEAAVVGAVKAVGTEEHTSPASWISSASLLQHTNMVCLAFAAHAAGLSCIILTMGSMGAALLTLCSHDTPAHSQRTCPHSQPLVQQPAQQRQDCPHSSSLSPAARTLLLSPTPCRRPGSCPHAHATSSGSSLGVAAGRTGPGRCAQSGSSITASHYILDCS